MQTVLPNYEREIEKVLKFPSSRHCTCREYGSISISARTFSCRSSSAPLLKVFFYNQATFLQSSFYVLLFLETYSFYFLQLQWRTVSGLFKFVVFWSHQRRFLGKDRSRSSANSRHGCLLRWQEDQGCQIFLLWSICSSDFFNLFEIAWICFCSVDQIWFSPLISLLDHRFDFFFFYDLFFVLFFYPRDLHDLTNDLLIWVGFLHFSRSSDVFCWFCTLIWNLPPDSCLFLFLIYRNLLFISSNVQFHRDLNFRSVDGVSSQRRLDDLTYDL